MGRAVRPRAGAAAPQQGATQAGAVVNDTDSQSLTLAAWLDLGRRRPRCLARAGRAEVGSGHRATEIAHYATVAASWPARATAAMSFMV